MTHNDTAPENHGVHLHSLIERVGCNRHKVNAGTACYTLPNNVDYRTDYVAACGSRIKKGGFIGRISAQSMRSEAPRKSGHAPKRTFKKKPNTRPASSRGQK